MGNYCHAQGCYFCACGSGLVIVGGALVVGGGRVCGDWGGGMVIDVVEVMLTSSPKLAPWYLLARPLQVPHHFCRPAK